MKLLQPLLPLVLVSLAGNLQAQKVDVPEVNQNSLGCSLDWLSTNSRTYFIQYSSDMQRWDFMPSIHSGDGTMLSTGFQCNTPNFFLRLNWTDQPDGGDPNAADFDGEGLGSLEELQAIPQTNPLNFDTDGDLLSDGAEKSLDLNATVQDSDGNGILDSDEDFDGDGLSTLFELTSATPTDPQSVDSDNDGIIDGVEFALNLDPNSADSNNDGIFDADEDFDNDGVSNLIEQNTGSNLGNGLDGGVPPAANFRGVKVEVQRGRIVTNAISTIIDDAQGKRYPEGLPFSYAVSNGVNFSGEIFSGSNFSIDFLESQVLNSLNSPTNQWAFLRRNRFLVSSGYHTYNPRNISIGVNHYQAATSQYSVTKFRLTRLNPSPDRVEQHFVEVMEESSGFTTFNEERQNVTREVKSFTLTIPEGGTKSSPYTVQAPLKNEVQTTSRVLSINLQTFSGQDTSRAVPEDEEETVGAFTIANLNDTDGDGIVDNTDQIVQKADNAGAGVEDEVDLMKLIVTGPNTGRTKVTVVSGAIEFWENSTKETKITKEDNAIFIDAADLPKILWVEATNHSNALRDIELRLGWESPEQRLLDNLDTVKATAIWVKPTVNGILTSGQLPDDADDPKIINAFEQILNGRFGIELLLPPISIANYSIGFEFEIFPNGAGSEPSVTIDLSRQRESILWLFDGQWFGNPQENFPNGDIPNGDIPNDDSLSEELFSDEDNTPKNHHIYSIDNPSIPFGNFAKNRVTRAVKRGNFKEFVRIRFDRKPFSEENGVKQGSRSSDFLKWQFRGDLSFDNIWNLTEGQNILGAGHQPLGQQP